MIERRIQRHQTLQRHYRDVFRTMSNIKDGVFRKNSSRLFAVNYFHKNFYLRCLTGYGIRFYRTIDFGYKSTEMYLRQQLHESFQLLVRVTFTYSQIKNAQSYQKTDIRILIFTAAIFKRLKKSARQNNKKKLDVQDILDT